MTLKQDIDTATGVVGCFSMKHQGADKQAFLAAVQQYINGMLASMARPEGFRNDDPCTDCGQPLDPHCACNPFRSKESV